MAASSSPSSTFCNNGLPHPVDTRACNSGCAPRSACSALQHRDICNGLRNAQPQYAGERRIVRDEMSERVDFAHDRATLFVDRAAHWRGFQRLGIAVEQFDAERFFEVLDAAGNGGLRQRERVRGLTERLTAHDGDERLDFIEFH